MGEPLLLDATAPQKVDYCIPLWLRDEQIKLATARVAARIEPPGEGFIHPDPVALVCYGPSLNQTWEDIRRFKHVMTCSGAHRFLVERGIIPTWHVEVDPRAHKVELIGTPHPDVEYLIASTCHPAVFDHLEKHGARVTLWHVFDAKEDAIRTLPPGEWALTGGCSVGLRTMTLARFLGYTRQHIFGMDGSAGESGKHAAAHPNQPKKHQLTEYPPGSGRMWATTPAMLEAARGTWHELNQMPDVQTFFYGDGLVQTMAIDYVREPALTKGIVGFTKPALISTEYRALNERLHRDNLAYGVGGGKHAEVVQRLVQTLVDVQLKPGHKEPFRVPSVLDYGCGKGYLAKALAFPIAEYDPAVPGKTESPRPADLVVCTDVLEHIEPDRLGFVLGDLQRCVRQLGYFVIHTGAAQKVLADGRNAHLIQRDAQWWRLTLQRAFHVGTMKQRGPEVHVVVAPRQAPRRVSARASAVLSTPRS